MHIQSGEEIARFEQTCPRHGARIRRYQGCPRCVVEIIQNCLRRFDASPGYEKPARAGSIYQGNRQLAENR
jgi:hypothetical protein